VTQAQWRAVAGWEPVERDLKPDPSYFKNSYKGYEHLGRWGREYDHWSRPVENVTWEDVIEFCARLSRVTGQKYRLPSEAEWEYACRARTVTPFHFGETISTEVANYDGHSTYGEGPKGKYRAQTSPVGYFQVTNAFGLYDMHGNVWEWCADPWHDNYEEAPDDGSIWLWGNSSAYVLRGGSWNSSPRNCRSAYRGDVNPDYRCNDIGFRVVRSTPRTL
jgi:formylglycine-generating enzyme required for sulfatase activity